MKTIEDQNSFLNIQVHAQPNTNSDEKTHEPKPMKSFKSQHTNNTTDVNCGLTDTHNGCTHS